MTTSEATYPRLEYERRFLVQPQGDWKRALEPYSKLLEDKYLPESRLRLRAQTDLDSGRRVFKLTRKHVSESPYFRMASRILLEPGEFALLDRLPGQQLRKVRHYHVYRGQVFSLDAFEGILDGLILCEVEATDLETLLAVDLPDYAQLEVTTDDFFAGGSLSQATRGSLTSKLAVLS